jgi:hypothetical protein
MYTEQGGEGPDLLLMLHGMGATGAVWAPMCASAGTRWRGRWLVLDLPGHGQSDRLDSYAIGQYAASVARAVLPHIDPAGRLVVLGHSLGGVVGVALATGWFGVLPQQVFAAGIKIVWTDEELRRMEALASQPAKTFATEEEALERYLKVSGLAGIANTADTHVVARARNCPQPPSTSCPAELRSLVRMPRRCRCARSPRQRSHDGRLEGHAVDRVEGNHVQHAVLARQQRTMPSSSSSPSFTPSSSVHWYWIG